MKIWFAAHVWESAGGGVGRSMRELAAGLSARGHRTEVYTREKVGGRTYLGFALHLALRLLRRPAAAPDWIVARSTDGLFCAVLARLPGLHTRVVLHNHGWEELVYRTERRLPRAVTTSPTTWKAKAVRFVLLRLALRTCRFCLSGTVHEARWLRRTYPRLAGRAIYIGNGVSPPRTPYWPERDAVEPHFLAVGGPTWKKNLEHTIALCAEIERWVPKTRLYLVGTGMGADGLERRLGPLPGVEVVAAEPYETMDRWYRTCPYLIVSSRYEGGHPLAALEAMSFGAIVFATAIPSVKEIITDGRNGVLIGGCDPAADARRVLETMRETGEAKDMRLRAFRTARRNRWERQLGRLERVLWTGARG